MKALVSVDQLRQNLNDKDLVLLDASPESTAFGKTSSLQSKTIPQARPFDLKGVFSDLTSQFPNMLPSPQQFEQACQKLGINKTSKIVVFDNLGIYSSPRVWWMFKVMGHNKVSVLNGGLTEWIEHDFPVEDEGIKEYNRGDFKADLQKRFVISYEKVLQNIDSKSFTIVDARSQGRFKGTEKEPREHLQSGHIPGSINIPYQDVLQNGKYKSEAELKAIFSNKAVDSEKLVFSCGSGLTACIVMLASEVAYQSSPYLYDGSWTEWAERQGNSN